MPIRVPYLSRNRWVFHLGWLLFCGLGLVCLAALICFWKREPENRLSACLIFLSLAAALFFLGDCYRRDLSTWLVLSPQSVRVQRGNRVLREIPGESIRLIYTVPAPVWDRWRSQIAVCSVTVSEIAQQREAELKKGIFTRDELVFRKRNAEWETLFCREYLDRAAKNPFSRQPRDIVYLPQGYCQWLSVLLRQLYPQSTFLAGEPDSLPVAPEETNVDSFRRSVSTVDETVLSVLAAVLFLPLLVILFFSAGWPGCLILLSVFLPGGLLFAYLLMKEREILTPKPDGIHISRRGKETYVWPAEQIRTVAAVPVPVRQSERIYLILSPDSPSQLAQAAWNRTKPGDPSRAVLEAQLQLPQGEARLAVTELCKLCAWQELPGTRILAVDCTPLRLKKLQETYPHAALLNLFDERASTPLV